MEGIKSEKEIAIMRESGKITAEILHRLASVVRPGLVTMELERLARALIQEKGAQSAFLGFEGYPAVICVSVNEVAVHGLPSEAALKDGDVVGIDFGVRWKGYCTDAALTVGVGNMSAQALRLIETTRRALELGIERARAGNTTGHIGASIQKYVEGAGLRIIKELAGHGVGKRLHEDPHIPSIGEAGDGPELFAGMTIAIEPIVTTGSSVVRKAKDGFGYETSDKSYAAHFEHTVLITEDKPEILTLF